MDIQLSAMESFAIPIALPVWFAETCLISLALAAIAYLICRSRKLGPSARHALWLVVLVRLVIPPTLHWPWAQGLETQISRSSAIQRGGEGIEKAEQALNYKLPAIEPEPPPTPPHPLREYEKITSILTPSTSEPPDVVIEPELASTDLAVEFKSNRFQGVAVQSSWTLVRVFTCVAWLWLLGSFVVAAVQVTRVLAFRRRLKPILIAPAPLWIVEETQNIARLLGIRAPSAWVVPGLATPMLWCLGRPCLLVPQNLVKEFDATRWRTILAHELAHLRRGDHWVSRLELVAGIVWWWNPVYWFARRHIDAEAELACDALVVSLLPDDRLTYADSLLKLCSKLSDRSSTTHNVPALGVAGSGPFFEKRLIMILRETSPSRTSAKSTLVAALLILISAPAWTLATPPDATSSKASEELATTVISSDRDNNFDAELAEASVSEIDALPVPPVAPFAPVSPVPPDAPRAVTLKGHGGQTIVAKVRPLAKQIRVKAKVTRDGPDDEEKQEKEAAELEAKMEAFAEKVEALAEGVVEKALGPEFEKRMEAIGKQMEKKYGPGSDFEKAMKEMGKDIEKKYGPGSDFEKMMKEMGKDIEKQFGPGSEFEKAMKKQAEGFKADESNARQDAKAAAETAQQTKKLAETLARKAKRQAEQEKTDDQPTDSGSIQHQKDVAEQDSRATALADEKLARDKQASERELTRAKQQKEREEARAHEEERKIARAKEAEARALGAKAKARDRKIKLLEEKLQKLMKELKELEADDQNIGGLR